MFKSLRISQLIFISGLISLLFGILLIIQQFIPVALQTQKQNSFNESGQTIPDQLIIDTLSINLPVKPVYVNYRNWPLINNGVALVANPQQIITSKVYLFYGHNWPALLGPLSKAQTGNLIALKLAGQEHYYRIDQKLIVSKQAKLPDLSTHPVWIYTCTGLFDQNRLLVSALPAGEI
jgi:sortase (surface protein transpeptidase)